MNKIRVMIVEDEVLIRMLISKYLIQNGCEIICETGYGEDAVDMSIKEKPDLILMDIKLQGDLNGIDASKIINEKTSIPIVLMSAFDYKEEVMKAQIPNMLYFLEKPVSKDNIQSIISKFKK